jgi:DTW domain-containing protein YfiP
MSDELKAPAGVTDEIPECARCGKPLPLCVCEEITAIKSRLSLVILQHPQEQDRLLGTARLTALHFDKAVLKIGLSWPSLSKILGRSIDPSRWAVLYLGSAKVADLETDQDIVLLDRKSQPEPHQRGILRDIEGVIVLDGTWSQAKALWWRNAWMLKCRRIILGPSRPSLYGKLRREPRRDGLSTIEATAMLLSRLEQRPDIESVLHRSFQALLGKYHEAQTEHSELMPAPKPRRDWRRRGPGKAR